MRAPVLALASLLAAGTAGAQVRTAPLPESPLEAPLGAIPVDLLSPSQPSLNSVPPTASEPSLGPGQSLDTLGAQPLSALEASPASVPAASLRRETASGAEMSGRAWSLPLSRIETARPAEAGSALDWTFDRSVLSAAGVRATDLPDTLPEGKDSDELELRFLSAHSKSILHSKRTGTIRLIRDTKGSRAYWKRFKRGADVKLLAGGYVLMNTKVESAATLPIGQLTKDDLKGVFSEKELQLFPVKRLRQAVIENLSSFGSHGDVTLDSKVRLIHYQSYAQMNQGREPPEIQATPRTPLKLEKNSPLFQMGQFLPKAVLLDLDMYREPIPSEILEDLAKLQRTGVIVVAMSRGSLEEVSDTLFKNMSGYQRDVLLPYRFVGAFEGGARLTLFERGGRTKTLSQVRFEEHELEAIRLAAAKAIREAGGSPRSMESTEPGLGLVDFKLPGSADAERFAGELRGLLANMEIEAHIDRTGETGRAVIRVSKTTLSRSMPRLLEALQDAHSVFVLGGDVAALTKDKTIVKSLRGMADLDALTGGELTGPELAENALGAMLAEHRENRPGDLAGSASRMSSFLKHHSDYLDQYVLDHEEAMRSIHFFSGHMVHKALDWAVHQIRLGRRPSMEEFSKKLSDYWQTEHATVPKPIGMAPGYTLEGMLVASQARGRVIYQHVLDIVDEGYELLGTELPNFFMLRSWERSGDVARRYVIHTIFDLVAARRTPDGKAELAILDFKSGPPQTMQKLAQDLQVLTYSLYLRYKWGRIPVPYRIAGGRPVEVVDPRVEFLYSPVRLSPPINMWALDKVERTITRTLDRIQKEQEENIPIKRKPKKRGDPRRA